MITIIFGNPRVGKTALMTSMALEYMTGANAQKDLRDCAKKVKKYNNGGFSLTVPREHLVYSDYDIFTHRKTLYSYYVDGYKLGLNTPEYPTAFLPPHSRVYLDEAQRYYNSRESSKLADFVSRFFELHGHFWLNITLAVQREKLIDLNIRQISARVLEVRELKHTYDCGIIVRSTWHCREYENTAEAEKSVSGEKGNYKNVKFVFEGNIFKHYDSYFHELSFLSGREASNFDCKPNGGYSCTVAGVKEFNAAHGFTVPDNFQKGDKKNKKVVKNNER